MEGDDSFSGAGVVEVDEDGLEVLEEGLDAVGPFDDGDVGWGGEFVESEGF